jgi:hypothetical protein
MTPKSIRAIEALAKLQEIDTDVSEVEADTVAETETEAEGNSDSDENDSVESDSDIDEVGLGAGRGVGKLANEMFLFNVNVFTCIFKLSTMYPTHCDAHLNRSSSSDEEFYLKKIRGTKIPGFAMLEPIKEVSFFYNISVCDQT